MDPLKMWTYVARQTERPWEPGQPTRTLYLSRVLAEHWGGFCVSRPSALVSQHAEAFHSHPQGPAGDCSFPGCLPGSLRGDLVGANRMQGASVCAGQGRGGSGQPELSGGDQFWDVCNEFLHSPPVEIQHTHMPDRLPIKFHPCFSPGRLSSATPQPETPISGDADGRARSVPTPSLSAVADQVLYTPLFLLRLPPPEKRAVPYQRKGLCDLV